MNRQEIIYGTLFIVSTPIGNLEDISFRAVRILQESDLILAEDTRRTGKLLNHYEIKTSMLTYHDHNSADRIYGILEKLKQGMSVALVTDGGTPCISDPGFKLVASCRESDIPVTAVPGASAVTTAVALAGIPSERFVFEGFLPRKKSERESAWKRLNSEKRAIVLYEAPHRFAYFLDELEAWMPDRTVAVCRELTKLHEEVVTGNFAVLKEAFQGRKIKGEFTIVIGCSEGTPLPSEDELEHAASEMLAAGMSHRAAAEALAAQTGVSYRKIYKMMLDGKKKKDR